MTVAAPVRHNPEFFTEGSTPPQPNPSDSATADVGVSRSWREEADRLIAECGIDDWDGFVVECQSLRGELGQPTGGGEAF
jgi:hypothetical protein